MCQSVLPAVLQFSQLIVSGFSEVSSAWRKCKLWMLAPTLCLGLATIANGHILQAQPSGKLAEDGYPEESSHFIRPKPLGAVNGKGGSEISGPYEVVEGWPKPLHADWVMGPVAAVHAESPNRIYVAVRGEFPARHLGPRAWGPDAISMLHPAYGFDVPKVGRWEHVILVFDKAGKLVESWEEQNPVIRRMQRMVVNPYDAKRHIWLTSGGILKFTHDGKKLVMSSREDCNPATTKCFSAEGSMSLDFLPNGDFFSAAGSKVIKYSKNGQKLLEFGKPGSGPGEFRGIHGVVLDPDRNRLYIADRSNSRIQVFDLKGKFLDLWPNILGPAGIRLTEDGSHLWVSDLYTQKFSKFDAMSGKMITNWGTFGVVPGAFWGIHDFDVDSEGNLYVAEDHSGRVQKLRPRQGADPEQLVGPLKPSGR